MQKSTIAYTVSQEEVFSNLIFIDNNISPKPTVSNSDNTAKITCPWMQGVEKKLKKTSKHSSISSESLTEQNWLQAGCWIPACDYSKPITATGEKISAKEVCKKSPSSPCLLSLCQIILQCQTFNHSDTKQGRKNLPSVQISAVWREHWLLH